jgi:transcriptional regulator with XRE-family HTH domain
MEVSETIKELREKMGLTQKEFAERFGTAMTTVSGWETGNRTPRLEVLEKLAEFFGVTVNYLLGDENGMSELESGFPEGVRMLRRANNTMSDEQKQTLVGIMEHMIETSAKNKKGG